MHTGVDPGILKPGSAALAWQNFWILGICFDTLSYIPYLFIVKVENKIHIINIALLLQLKYMQSKFTKINPISLILFSNRGARARCASPGSAFGTCNTLFPDLKFNLLQRFHQSFFKIHTKQLKYTGKLYRLYNINND